MLSSFTAELNSRQHLDRSEIRMNSKSGQGAAVSRTDVSKMKLLLVGNYAPDQQESMQRFAQMMLKGLRDYGIQAELLCPEPFFGRLIKSGTGLGKWLGYIDKFLIFPILLRRKLSQIRNPKTCPERSGAESNGSEIQNPFLSFSLRPRQSSISNPQSAISTIVHICDHSNALYTRYLQNTPHLVTCHDLLAVRSALGEFPRNPTAWPGRCLQAMILHGLKHAQHIACDSKATRRDVRRLTSLPEKQVSSISIALNYPYSPMPREEALQCVRELVRSSSGNQIAPPARFIFHVGGNQWYKNRMGVLRIYSQFIAAEADSPALIMAGKPFTPEMTGFVMQNGLQDQVICVESCSNEDLRALYSAAECLLFPSLAEGFGWPVIEAQACGCSVVCSNVASLPEVAGDAAVLCDPADDNEFAHALQSLCTNESHRGGLISRGFQNVQRFSTEKMIEGYLSAYRHLLT